MSAQVAQPSEIKQLLALMAQLAALTDAVSRLREAQDRAGQARAARQAAQALRAVTDRYARQGVPLNGGPEALPVPVATGLGGRVAERARPYGPDPEQPGQAPSSPRPRR